MSRMFNGFVRCRVDTSTGVNDNDYQVPFRFTGTLES